MRTDRYADAIYDEAVDHPMWIGDDGKPLDYLPERASRLVDFAYEAAEAVMDVADAEQAELRAEVARLRRWKAEATEVILGLQDLGKALGLRLGERITGESATEAAKRLTARAETAEAKVARVEGALANHPRACEKHPDGATVSCGWKSAVLDVQRALDGA